MGIFFFQSTCSPGLGMGGILQTQSNRQAQAGKNPGTDSGQGLAEGLMRRQRVAVRMRVPEMKLVGSQLFH
jgi:hypothetical protein